MVRTHVDLNSACKRSALSRPRLVSVVYAITLSSCRCSNEASTLKWPLWTMDDAMTTGLGSQLVVHKMEEDEFVRSFDCGDADLNDFITNEAHNYRKALLAVTYVLTPEDSPNDIVAFCSLANDRISLTDFETSTEFNRFRRQQGFPQAKRMKSYPAVKICRLGVSSNMRGKSAGSKFLDFVKTYFSVDNKTGCRFVTVDAYIHAIPFYLKNGFQPLNSDDEDSTYTRTLFFDLKDIL